MYICNHVLLLFVTVPGVLILGYLHIQAHAHGDVDTSCEIVTMCDMATEFLAVCLSPPNLPLYVCACVCVCGFLYLSISLSLALRFMISSKFMFTCFIYIPLPLLFSSFSSSLPLHVVLFLFLFLFPFFVFCSEVKAWPLASGTECGTNTYMYVCVCVDVCVSPVTSPMHGLK